ncbi:hypothetical protein ml_243 [Mollivirus sibericum]|nr:hypothetical protein ml_243 [Mollivirus sibericum]ALD62045.1 hypothetical protein ml_243 [Mollivirus sibericum]
MVRGPRTDGAVDAKGRPKVHEIMQGQVWGSLIETPVAGWMTTDIRHCC